MSAGAAGKHDQVLEGRRGTTIAGMRGEGRSLPLRRIEADADAQARYGNGSWLRKVA